MLLAVTDPCQGSLTIAIPALLVAVPSTTAEQQPLMRNWVCQAVTRLMHSAPQPVSILRALQLAQASGSLVVNLTLRMQLYGSSGVWSTGDVSQLDQLLAEDHSQRDMIWQPEKSGGGPERMGKGVASYRDMIPNLKFEIVTVAADEQAQRCFVEWSATGEHKVADLSAGAAAKSEVKFGGTTVLQVQDGKVVESRVYRDAPKGERASFKAQATSVTMEP